MADEVERVEYVFEGDVSSLRSASSTAIELLRQYSDSMKRASETDAFAASKRATTSMNASLGRLNKDLTKIQSKLKNVGDVKLPTGSAPMQAMVATLSTLGDQMQQMSTKSSITSKDLKTFRDQIESTRSTLQSTAPQVDKLVRSEQRFQNVLDTVQSKADKFRQTMESTKEKISDTFNPVSNKLRTFSSLFDGISQKVQSFKDKAAIAFSRVSQLADSCASAFRRTAQEADNTEDAHSGLSGLLDKLSARFKKTSTSAETEADAVEDTGDAAKKAVKKTTGLSTALGNLSSAFSRVARSAIALLGGVKLGEWLAKGAKESINLIENLNLFTVAMGKSLNKGLQFVDNMSEIYGMDPSNLYRYAGYFYQLTDAIGMADSASATMSLSMTKAANDIASLFNQDIETVVNNLASGMQGMSRAVRKYGMDIRATTLQQTALQYGLTGQVESMSEANRMALRYITMMNQVRNATQQVSKNTKNASDIVGDFANNIETPANQLRIFKEQMQQLGRAIGNFIIAPLSKAMAYINGFIMALRMTINFIGSLLGVINTQTQEIAVGSDLDDVSKSVSGIGTAAAKSKKQVKDLLAPFDELNILQEQAATGSDSGAGLGSDVLDPNLAKALEDIDLGLDNIRMKANDVRDAILNFLGFELDGSKIIKWNPDKLFANIRNSFQELFSEMPNFLSGLMPIFDSIGKFLKPVIDTVSSLLHNVFDIVLSTVQSIQKLYGTTIKPVLNAISTAIQKVFGILQALWEQVLGPVIEYVGNGLSQLWQSTILPIFELIVQSVGNLIEAVLGLWNNVLAPFIKMLIEAWGPSIRNVLMTVWDVIQSVFSSIGGVIQGLLQAFNGITDFLAGIFTGNWKRALKGLVNVFVGIANTLIGVVETLVNGIISIINSAISLIYNAVLGLINTVLSAVESIAKLLGKDISLTIGSRPPEIPALSIPRIPMLATGGVVTSPTMTMVGEGKYSEAIVPLDDSPQMQNLVQRIADAVDKKDTPSGPVEVRVYIGDKEWDAFTYKSAQRGSKLVGSQPVEVLN